MEREELVLFGNGITGAAKEGPCCGIFHYVTCEYEVGGNKQGYVICLA